MDAWQLRTVYYQGKLPLRRSQWLVSPKVWERLERVEEKLNTRNQHATNSHDSQWDWSLGRFGPAGILQIELTAPITRELDGRARISSVCCENEG